MEREWSQVDPNVDGGLPSPTAPRDLSLLLQAMTDRMGPLGDAHDVTHAVRAGTARLDAAKTSQAQASAWFESVMALMSAANRVLRSRKDARKWHQLLPPSEQHVFASQWFLTDTGGLQQLEQRGYRSVASALGCGPSLLFSVVPWFALLLVIRDPTPVTITVAVLAYTAWFIQRTIVRRKTKGEPRALRR